MPQPADREQRVLVLAPTGRDAALLSEMLRTEALTCTICRNVEELATEIRAGAGIALLAEEALIGDSLAPLLGAIAEQPGWSDFPLIFLTASGMRASETSTRLLKLLAETNVSILEKPVRVATLVSSVRSALRARGRQYQVRDYLEERGRNEEKLRQTQKLESLGVLAGGVAHDFNNLLTGILGNASLAIECLPAGAEEAKSLMEDVVSATDRAAHLTRQLLAYAGKGRFVIETLDLSELVRAVTHLIQSSISKNARLRLELAGGLPSVEGDAAQMQQIIMNLVINAGEAIPADRTGEIRVTTSLQQVDALYIQQNLSPGEIAPGPYVVLQVHDTGEGMDEERVARIFDPFFTTKFTGRGLGLAAVLGIVRGHKGALKVYSVPKKGSTFKVFFPAGSALAVRELPKAAPQPPKEVPQGSTVLIIDDEETVRRTAAAALQHYGYKTIAANGGAEGIDAFKAAPHAISVVLLDLTMPGLGGEEVFRRLRDIRSDVCVVLSSGFNEVEVIQRFTGQGLAGFIQKPYTSGGLAAKLRAVLDS